MKIYFFSPHSVLRDLLTKVYFTSVLLAEHKKSSSWCWDSIGPRKKMMLRIGLNRRKRFNPINFKINQLSLLQPINYIYGRPYQIQVNQQHYKIFLFDISQALFHNIHSMLRIISIENNVYNDCVKQTLNGSIELLEFNKNVDLSSKQFIKETTKK